MKKFIKVLILSVLLLLPTSLSGNEIAELRYWQDPQTGIVWMRLQNNTPYRLFCQVWRTDYNPPMLLEQFYISGSGASQWAQKPLYPIYWECYS